MRPNRPPRLLAIAALAVGMGLSAGAAPARAAVISWAQPVDGAWSDPANWSPAVVPGPADDARIDVAGYYTVTIDTDSVRVASLEIGMTSGFETIVADAATALTAPGGVAVGAYGIVRWNGGAITGGAWSNDGDVLVDGVAFTPDLANRGLFTKSPTTTLAGVLDNHGRLTLQGVTVASPALVNHTDGLIRIEGTPVTPAVFELPATYVNPGELDLACALGHGDAFVRPIGPDSSTIALVNAPGATMHVYAMGARRIEASLVNHGTFDVEWSCTLPRAGAAHLNDGLLKLSAAGLTVNGAGAGFTNRGVLEIDAGFEFAQTAGTFVNDSAGTIHGLGTCTVNAIPNDQRGTIAPGLPYGRLTFTGSLTVAPAGTVQVTLADTTAAGHSTLRVTGFLIPQGVLRVEHAPGFAPVPGDRFAVIGYGDHSGVFARIDGLDLGNGLALRPEYDVTGLTLECFAGHVAGVPPAAPPRALAFARPPAPNPSRAGCAFALALPRAGAVRVDVIDLAGRRVATLLAGTLPAGDHDVRWDGRDGRGASLPAGVYTIAVHAPGGEISRRVVLAP